MYKKLFLTLGITALSINALAGETSFAGPYVGGTLILNNLDVNAKNSTTNLDFKNDGINLGLGVDIGYGMLRDNLYYFGVEAGVKTSNGKAKYSSDSVRATIEGQQSWSLSILPGIKSDNLTLFYGRFGVGSVSGKAKVPSVNYSESEDLDSMLWGLGMQRIFKENLAARVEISNTSFDKGFKSSGEKWSGDITEISFGVQAGF